MPPDGTKTCYACGRTLPLEQFRLRKRSASARQGRCRACYNAYMREFRRRRRNKALGRFAAEIAAERTTWERTASLCRAMMLRFGGPVGFSGVWAQSIQEAKPGTGAALRAAEGVVSLAAHCERNRPAARQLELIPDEELEAEYRQAIADCAADCPELLCAVLTEAGWTAIPPPAK